VEPSRSSVHDCPVCRDKSYRRRPAIFWSKAGQTYRLCDKHKAEARAYRRFYK